MNLNSNLHVKLTKLAESNPGKYALGYYIKGILITDVEIDSVLRVARYVRSAREVGEVGEVEVSGVFTSSRVRQIDSNKIITDNSTWQIELLPENETAENFRKIYL